MGYVSSKTQLSGAFPFSRLEIQLFDLSRYFVLYQWSAGLMKSMGYMIRAGKWEYAPIIRDIVTPHNFIPHGVVSPGQLPPTAQQHIDSGFCLRMPPLQLFRREVPMEPSN